jgi:F-type H+-transporting ATPase subunit alpha
MAVLNKGRRNVEILKQPQYSPMSVGKQIAIIYCGTQNLLKDVPVESVTNFETEYLNFLETKHKDVLDKLASGVLSDKAVDVLKKAAADIAEHYKK